MASSPPSTHVPIPWAGRPLLWLERAFDKAFTPAGNPLYQLGALTIFFFWVVLVSGIYVFVFFHTSVEGAFQSVERLTHEQWWLGGVMRSLHRYASDAAVITLFLHMAREFIKGRYKGARWYSWFTGVPLLWMVFPLGITGYWLVWDQLGVYVATLSAELLDALPIFTDPMARNFLTAASVSDRFFTLLAFIHLIGLPIFLVFGIWFHVFRIARPTVNPSRRLAVSSLLALVALSFVFPALSQGPADLQAIPPVLKLDWFYLPAYPLLDLASPGAVWGLLFGSSLLISLLPWIGRKPKAQKAVVDLANCNGCGRCFDDCPYSAITMAPRDDGRGFKAQAVVDPDLCTACGICAGACPSATPFRSIAELVSGIDMPDQTVHALRAHIQTALAAPATGPKVLVVGCDHAVEVEQLKAVGAVPVSLPCTGNLPPSFVDYALKQAGADGVLITGCGPCDCHFRLGAEWTEERLAGEREPSLRARVDRERVAVAWAAMGREGELREEFAAFRDRLAKKEAADA